MDKIVNVTPNRIRRGESQSSSSCPIALAIKPLIKEEIKTRVTQYYVSFSEKGLASHVDIPTPDVAAKFIRRFDMEKEVKPFRFTLGIPEEFLK